MKKSEIYRMKARDCMLEEFKLKRRLIILEQKKLEYAIKCDGEFRLEWEDYNDMIKRWKKQKSKPKVRRR